MPLCNEHHVSNEYNMSGTKKPVKHFYIAGICIHSSKVTIGLQTFLRQAFPYFYGATYSESRIMKEKPIES